MPKILSIDIETYSDVDIKKTGVYPYAESPNFEILLIAYAYDRAPVRCFDMTQRLFWSIETEQEFQYFLSCLKNPEITKTAFNAQFEMTCLGKEFGELNPMQWECTMVRMSMLGFPQSLGEAAKVLGVVDGKLDEGKTLVNWFCKPDKNGNRRLPEQHPEKWLRFIEYCIRDVEVERELRTKTSFYTIPPDEQRLYALDQTINRRGVLIDKHLPERALAIWAEHVSCLLAEQRELTGLDNPNSVAQLKDWLSVEMDDDVDTLNKKTVEKLIGNHGDLVDTVLALRQEISKTSIKKYNSMVNVRCHDGRVRGLLQFCGAGRTWRWAGRLIQVQNLPQNKMKQLEMARNCALSLDRLTMEVVHGNVASVLSQLIRTAFVAPKGKTFAVSDFSAIEAVVLSYLAKEEWRLEVFRTHGRIYEASASKMFSIPLETIGKKSPYRQRGKVAELAFGYQGGVGAAIQMGALDMGIPEADLQGLVNDWRAANPKIVKFWKNINNAAITCIENSCRVNVCEGVWFYVERGILSMHIPSGRSLRYPRAKLVEGKYGHSVVYEGIDQNKKKWGDISIYGGKFTENLVQAFARDCLSVAMTRLADASYDIVMHVHDEVVIEVDEYAGEMLLEDINRILALPISWALGLPLKAEGYVTKFYKKDD